jgi:rfaE bifunctional protein nucleotidyltransferase chain/domain
MANNGRNGAYTSNNGHNGVHEKIKTLRELATIVTNLKRQGRVVVHCHGVFDLVHPGHILHFENAKCQGDVLVVTLTRDEYVNKGPDRPVFNQNLRAESLAALQVVDYVAINEWPTAVETIHTLRPDVYAKGNEYANHNDLTGNICAEEKAIREIGGRIYFTDDITFSSTRLLNSYFSVFSPEAKDYLQDFRQRYTVDEVIGRLQALRQMRVLVVGDVIIDEYCFCRPLGLASKSTTVNAKFLNTEAYAGGVLCVANHVAGFCEHVDLISCLGEHDSYQDFIKEHLKPNITPKFFIRPGAPTTVKRRFVEAHSYTRLFEVSIFDDHPLPEPVEQELGNYLEQSVKDYDLVLVADFGHGLIGPNIVNELCRTASYLAVNTQTNSANMGFNVITKYPRADYICLDEPEIRLACHDKFGPLGKLIECTAMQAKASTLTITRGPHGSTTWQRRGGIVHAPAFTAEAVDTTGAGDAYLALTAPCAAADYPPDLIGFIGNSAGALAVRVLGNKESVEQAPLFKFIVTLLK